ncbi:MAG: diguanylate cyclase [Myxococcaceae bacterium]|nr:diguanylate cyclase [Myxococcaceae bacterium]MCA3013859.1 diguanylate cyclase [Myxococcaceae bacterium]
MTTLRVLVADPSPPICAAVRKFLGGLAEVQAVHSVDGALRALTAEPYDVLMAAVTGTFDGEGLAAQLRQRHPALCTVLVYPSDEEQAFERATAANADVFLTGPLKRPGVLNAVRAVLKLRELRERVLELSAKLEALQASPPAPALRGKRPGLNTADEAFFKKYMLLEVKRSKRYAYPVALLLVSLDGLEARLANEPSPEFQRAAIRTEVMSAVSELVRDIDVAMPFAEDKFLVFLPHTPRSGARIVAQRMVERLAALAAFEGGTASVGLSGFDPAVDPTASVSFGALVREATMALKRAREAGGNRVELPAVEGGGPAPSAKPKKNRISMG